jgi:uncharacterized protein (UPF0335 family)
VTTEQVARDWLDALTEDGPAKDVAGWWLAEVERLREERDRLADAIAEILHTRQGDGPPGGLYREVILIAERVSLPDREDAT